MAVWGSDIENGETASVAGGTMIDAACASAAGAPATVAESAPAANRSRSRRDGAFESEFLNLFCIGFCPFFCGARQSSFKRQSRRLNVLRDRFGCLRGSGPHD
jgi:hypothetical protein